MGEFSPPPFFSEPPSFFFFLFLKYWPQTPQPGFGSITLLQKFTHFTSPGSAPVATSSLNMRILIKYLRCLPASVRSAWVNLRTSTGSTDLVIWTVSKLAILLLREHCKTWGNHWTLFMMKQTLAVHFWEQALYNFQKRIWIDICFPSDWRVFKIVFTTLSFSRSISLHPCRFSSLRVPRALFF